MSCSLVSRRRSFGSIRLKEARAGRGRLSKISKGNMEVMTMATDSSKIKPPGRLLLPVSLTEIGKACGGDTSFSASPTTSGR